MTREFDEYVREASAADASVKLRHFGDSDAKVSLRRVLQVVEEFLASAAIVHDDSRMGYIDVQIGREEWRELCAWFAPRKEGLR